MAENPKKRALEEQTTSEKIEARSYKKRDQVRKDQDDPYFTEEEIEARSYKKRDEIIKSQKEKAPQPK